MPTTAAHLTTIETHLRSIDTRITAIEVDLASRVTTSEMRQALQDILETLGQLAQLREIYATQRDAVAALVVIANLLLGEERAHDASSAKEREQLRGLLVQLRELGRKHVAGLTDLERAIYGGLTPEEQARQESESARPIE